MKIRVRPSLVAAWLAASSSLCAPAVSLGAPESKATVAAAGKPDAAEAKAFISRINVELKKLFVRQQTAEWIKSTYITDDTERNAATADEEVMAFLSKASKDATRYSGLPLDEDTARSLKLLRLSSSPLPAPDDGKKREELAGIAAKLEGLYGKGKWCGNGANGNAAANTSVNGAGNAAANPAANPDGKSQCRDLQALSNTMAKSHNFDELLDAWVGWHTIARPMRALYERLVTLGNEGSKEIGFDNLGDLWRSGYDMPPADFEKETDRLWGQVKPLYDDLHCYVRGKLQKTYGKDKVPDKAPIPAHLLGNMWAQEWTNIYPLVEPYPGTTNLDVDAALKQKGIDEVGMVKLGEAFFVSMGLDPLPASFWERSMIKKPRDRDVVCHASAWDVTYDNDLRIKMCVEMKEEDLTTIHHELGHDYYYHSYFTLPVLYQQGANDGFHEAIGDAITLSITPAYLKQLGLVPSVPTDKNGMIDVQMKMALEKVAFLPFGKLIDQWRWDVFSGKTKPDHYNQAWWELRKKYQGVSAPVTRSEEDFDPGAKYHIPANVPYTRYFLARILQFQFHKALCAAAGYKGPLNECSVYGSKEAGKKLSAMLSLGASKPWPEALFAMTGQRNLDAGPLLEYFAPLRAWLKTQNKGQSCGW